MKTRTSGGQGGGAVCEVVDLQGYRMARLYALQAMLEDDEEYAEMLRDLAKTYTRRALGGACADLESPGRETF